MGLQYDKYSNISNTFLFQFSNKMLFIMAGIHKLLITRFIHASMSKIQGLFKDFLKPLQQFSRT